MQTHYAKAWNNSIISQLYNMNCRSAQDFSRLEATFRVKCWNVAFRKFQKKFQVLKEHQQDKKAIMKCLDYHINLKVLHLLASTQSSKNPNRETVLQESLNFFDNNSIESSTNNEYFLAQTLRRLVDLPINRINLEASVSLEYALSYICSLANIDTYEELEQFLSLFKNITIVGLDHNYIALDKLNFTSSSAGISVSCNLF